ncbi:MAG: hypoxanthine phosphoribosyltransferase [Bacteroidetes bacterium RIFCSPLOWO2_12_FULL_35_15]|nr:MAG: hypoxanthine phosphoribosyltransferase [Bacteroidetes bacterium RIFCSPLOWO2_12_FULL_35_15]
MNSIKIHDLTFEIKITSTEIQQAVSEVATKINTDLKGKKPLFLAVLNGSFMFASDLLKKVTIDCEISFVKVASYEGTSSTGEIKGLIGMNEDIKGRTVVIVEDIVDTGNTVENVWNELKTKGAADVKIATLLFKPLAYTKTLPIDYIAIKVPNDFLVGYGLDYNGLGRNLADIYVKSN